MNIDEIIRQAPVGITNEEIMRIYEKNNCDKMGTLMELWEIEEKKVEKKKDNWDDIREICDAHDIEMGKMMEIARKKWGIILMETLNYNKLHNIIMRQYEKEIRAKEGQKNSNTNFRDSLAEIVSNPSMETLGKATLALGQTIGDDLSVKRERRDDRDKYIYLHNK